jgi:hypothetical protein
MVQPLRSLVMAGFHHTLFERTISMPVMKLNQAMITQGIPLPDGVARMEAVDADLPGLYIEIRATAPGQGTYYLRYKDNSKKTCHKRIGATADMTLADARKAAKVIKADIAKDIDPKGEPKKVMLTYDAFFQDEYLPYVTPRKRSWKRDEELYRLRLKKVFGHLKLDAITRQQIQSFHTAILAEGLSPASADHHVKLLRQSLNLAIEWDMLDKNPAAKVPLFNVDNKVEHYLDDERLWPRMLEVRACVTRRALDLWGKLPCFCCPAGWLPLTRGAVGPLGLTSTKQPGCGAFPRLPWRSQGSAPRWCRLADSALEVLAELGILEGTA